MMSKNTQKNWEKYSQAKDLLDLLPVKSGRLLDIGCGQGHLAGLAKRRGFEVTGIDPLVNVSLEEYRAKRKFDVIILKHVLEHISNPKPFLKKIHRLLVSRGILLVACPNIGSLMARIFLDRWYGLQPQQHRWQFTPKTLPNLLKENGFIIDKVIVNNLWYKVPGIKGLVFWVLLRLADFLTLGDQVVVIAKKR